MNKEKKVMVGEQDSWAKTSKGQELIKQNQKIAKEGQKALESMRFPCPVDGSESVYIGEIGNLQMIVPVFQCTQAKHKFSKRLDLLERPGRLLRDQGWTSNQVK